MNTTRWIIKFALGLALLIFLPVSETYAQQLSTKSKKAIRYYQQADLYLSSAYRRFEEAKELLYSAIQEDPEFVEAYLKLASIHKLFNDSEKARKALQKAADLKPSDPALAGAYLLLADLYMENSSFDKAAVYYEKVIQVQVKDQTMLMKAESRLKSAKFAAQAIQNPVPVKPKKMEASINNFHAQGYPILTADNQTMLFYVLRTPDSKGDIMISQKNTSGQWEHAVSLSEAINSDADEGAPTMSADGRSVVFAACQRPGSVGGCDLYISYREGDEWTAPENLGNQVNSSAWDSEPSISADGRTLYFSSDRPVAKGRRDRNIWMSQKDAQGAWSKAVALGAPINTPGDEVSPFIHANNQTLYFASNFHPGMGGYDVFYSRKKDTTWSTPVNLGYPLNTTDNDGTIFITTDGATGYYSVFERNARYNSASFIYEFEMPETLKEENRSTYSKGIVTDKISSKPLKATIELIDLQSAQVSQSVQSDKVSGSYLLVLTQGQQYVLRVSAEGYLFESRMLDFRSVEKLDPLSLNFQLTPAKSGASIVLNNIFFQSNSAELQKESFVELDKIADFLSMNPTLRIELSGHTDDIGSDAENLLLSGKRATTVYDYLLKKGIKAERLKHTGLGERKPKYPNNNEANRALNRRIEFKIL
ncbi:MAG: OmpA family protein [Cytophagaceae bacterium]|jgi:outer membrane protein OmpA-like peptidoglycan-associated protein/tetratricopeptide (TPR) repeat protein|nr:OmpA family protein [Cytophagaceae bacterium]